MPDLFGVPRTLPADGATNWGSDVRGVLEDLIKAVDGLATLVGDVPYLVLKKDSQTVSAAGTVQINVTPGEGAARGDLTAGSAITLGADSTDVIDDGTVDGQTLMLVGTSNSNTIRIDSDHQNVAINGDIVLGQNDAIFLMWNGTDWVEISRSN